MEFNVDEHVKSYWDNFVGLTDEDDEIFVDATSDNSVRASQFLEGLDLSSMMPQINKYYMVKEGIETYPRRAMVKTLIWRKIKKLKYYTQTERYLESHPDEALELGFNIDQCGNVIVPDHETLRHFEKVRLKNEGMDAIFSLFCIKVVELGNKLGLRIGENTGTDSTPIATPHDPDGKYNGHYKKKMVKSHITMDYDYPLPLAKKVCGGTDDDDKHLESMFQMVTNAAGMNMNETWYDGGYNSNKNIAISHVKFGLRPHYHIDTNWRENVTYEHKFHGKSYIYTPEQQINYLYNKRWKNPYYKKDASLKYKMQCLIEEAIYEPVAMYFRNDYMREYEECPDGVIDVYHRRNGSEGINSYMKEHLGLETHINGKGMKNIDLHVTQCCIALLAVTMTRLQNGIIENLASVAYLT